MTVLASPRYMMGLSIAAGPRASCSSRAKELAAAPLPGQHGYRPHTLGDAMARRPRTTPIRTPHKKLPSSTMASSRISRRCARNWRGGGEASTAKTDTEVVAHLVSELVEQGTEPQEAVKRVLPRLHGAFALAILFRSHPDMLIGARLGSPLVVGYGDGETYLGSDALALAPLTQRIAYLEEGDWVVITREARKSSTATTSRSNAP